MLKNLSYFLILLFFSFLSLSSSAQYGPQFDNPGFEDWTNRANEPVHWHSGGTATGTWSSLLPVTLEQSVHPRPGSAGTKSARLVPQSVMGVTANGNLTNGRMNAGSMSPSGSSNYNYTQRSQNLYNTPITQIPDSLTVWVCFRSQSSSDRANVKAVIHGDADYQVIADGTESPANMHVATANMLFTRTSTASGSYTWRRLSIPFVNNGPCTDVRYILFIATTNETPGSGSTNDDLFLDDVLLVYNPTLSMGQLSSTSLMPDDAIIIPFTLTGTMSPNNLNASANQVIAQLSDANGNFSSPTELGRVTTNTSGSILAQIPNVPDGQHYKIRVVSTNYPMIGQNMQEVTITSPSYTIEVTANPTNGGTVSGGGTYYGGQSCTVHASAATGYTFTNWTDNGTQVSTQPDYTFIVNDNRSLVANFTQQSYTITATADPSNGGTVSGAGQYNHGASCTLTATANTGYTFSNWTENGNVVSTNASYTFTVDGNRNLVANFSNITYTITVSANPNNSGTVSGGGTYNHGQSCTVIATSADGYTFTNWTENGSVVSTNANYTFTVNSDRALIANFEEQLADTYNINVSPNPINGGTVTGGGSYMGDEPCTVTATANEGYTFLRWTEDGDEVSSNASYTFIVTGNRTLVANFTANPLPTYTITAACDPTEAGRVLGGGTYQEGQSCTLTAISNEDYAFVNWTKDDVEVSTETTFTFTVTADETYVAHFQYTESVEEEIVSAQVFPNPATTKVSISDERVIKTVYVYDIMGRLVKQANADSTSFVLDLSDLHGGTYMLRLDYGESVITHRIVKLTE